MYQKKNLANKNGNIQLEEFNKQVFEKLKDFIISKKTEELENFFNSKDSNNFNINYLMSTNENTSSGDKIERETNINTKETLLHTAIIANNLPAIKILVMHKADLNSLLESKTTTIIREYNSYTGQRMSEPKIDEEKKVEFFPIELACYHGYLEIAKFLISQDGKFRFEKINEKFKIEIFNLQMSHLEQKNNELAAKNKQLIEDNLKTNSRKEQDLKYLNNKKFFRSLTLAQKIIRGHLIQKKYKRDKINLKQQMVARVEKEATETIYQLTKKKRFEESKKLLEAMMNNSHLDAQNLLLGIKKELAKEDHSGAYYLLLGEGNFSFTCSLAENIEKKEKRIFLVASDLKSFKELTKDHSSFENNRIALSRKNYITVLEQIDATKINLDNKLKEINSRYKRIYFNFPHDGNSYSTGTLKQLLLAFFQAARLLQKPGDKIYMLLPKEDWRYIKAYNIYENTSKAGYIYYKKKADIEKRYPGYHHTTTKKSSNSIPFSINQYREHIFMRSDYSEKNIKWQVPPKYYQNKECLPEMSSAPLDSSQDTQQSQASLELQLNK